MQSFNTWFEDKDNKKVLADFLRKHNQQEIYLNYVEECEEGYFSFPNDDFNQELLTEFPNWLKEKQISSPMYYFDKKMMEKDNVPVTRIKDLESTAVKRFT